MKVYLVNQEISDQYGTHKVVGVYSSLEKASAAADGILRHRAFVTECEVDALPVKDLIVVRSG